MSCLCNLSHRKREIIFILCHLGEIHLKGIGMRKKPWSLNAYLLLLHMRKLILCRDCQTQQKDTGYYCNLKCTIQAHDCKIIKKFGDNKKTSYLCT